MRSIGRTRLPQRTLIGSGTNRTDQVAIVGALDVTAGLEIPNESLLLPRAYPVARTVT